MSLRSFRRVLGGSRGQSLVEFTLSAVMLILLMFGVFEMGRMLLVYTTVANAAKAGVRYAIVHDGTYAPATTAQLKTLVKGYLSAAPVNLSNPNLAITPIGFGGAIGSTVSVTVTYPYDPWVGFYTHLLSINISSTSEGVITW
jgi:Flp pilus assembly protein TadG